MDTCKKHSQRSIGSVGSLSSENRNPPLRSETYSTFKGSKEPTQPEDSKLKNPEISFLFNPERDQTKPYHLDGDMSMYTEAAVGQRQALKSNKLVESSINDFMQLYKDDENGEISRTEYERVYDKLISILRPGTDVMEKKKLMAEDWKRDCKGQETMTKEMLYDCLFEMVDVWCPNIDPNDYKAFFDQIKFRIRYEGQNDSRAYDILG